MELKVVMKVNVKPMNFYIDCPHCGYELEGWVDDPRGTGAIEHCDNCNEVFVIPDAAVVVLK